MGALALFADMAAAAAQTPQKLPEVVVTGSAGPLGTADTASQGSVSAEQLEQRPFYRVGQLLESVPGLIVTQHSGEGKANQYFLRGFNLDHGTDIAITLDDMPVNMRTHAHGQGYSDLNFMIPDLVSGIQYRKGPYFADEADFATAGAVHIDYVDTLPRDLVSLSAGTLGNYRGFTAASRPWAGGNLLVALEYNHLDGPWVIPDDFNKGNAVVRYSQGSADNGFSLTGMFMKDAFHASNQIPERAVASGLISRYGTIDPSDGGNSERYSLSGKYVETGADGQLKANAYFIGYNLQLFNDFDYALTFPSPINDQFLQQDRRQVYGANVSYTGFGQLFGRASDNTIGFQTRTDNIDLELARTTDRVTRFVVRDDHVIESSGGVYVENRTQWYDKVRTIAGLREDLFYGSDASSLAANSGATAKGITSPKGSLVFGPWQQTELYLSAGQGFHSNDVRGALTTVDALQTLLNRQQGSSATAVQGKTPLLTKATGYEIGLRSEIVPRLRTEIAFFLLDLDSEATFDGDEAVTTAGRPSERLGVEISGVYRALPWLTFDGSFAVSRARFTNTDDAAAMSSRDIPATTFRAPPRWSARRALRSIISGRGPARCACAISARAR
ncbi:MAG: TonB-dependent receptor plug domain-containing protein [Pseudomonadota bacterium]